MNRSFTETYHPVDANTLQCVSNHTVPLPVTLALPFAGGDVGVVPLFPAPHSAHELPARSSQAIQRPTPDAAR